MATNWAKTAGRYNRMIEEHLKAYFKNLKIESNQDPPFIEQVHEHLAEYTLRPGKRLASICTIITYSGYRHPVTDEILRICVGIELYRHSILIHDDVVDDEPLRRGGKVFHNLFSSRDERLGRGTAIFAGNIAYTLAIQQFLSSKFEPSRVERAVNLLNESFMQVNKSQILDLAFEFEEPDEQEWYTMASNRAASLFKATIILGALLGEAPESDIPRLTEAAENIGYAFDIQDDIIDTFASRNQYGRDPGADLMRRKKPLHIVYAMKRANAETLTRLQHIRSSHLISADDLEAIRRGIKECGALDAAKDRSHLHAERARNLIRQVDLSDSAKNFFNSLLTFISDSLNWYG
jgi:geranylgeranyl diphosphate synthase type II